MHEFTHLSVPRTCYSIELSKATIESDSIMSMLGGQLTCTMVYFYCQSTVSRVWSLLSTCITVYLNVEGMWIIRGPI